MCDSAAVVGVQMGERPNVFCAAGSKAQRRAPGVVSFEFRSGDFRHFPGQIRDCKTGGLRSQGDDRRRHLDFVETQSCEPVRNSCCRDRPRPVAGGDRAAFEQRAPLTVADLYSFNRVRFRLRSQKSLYISG